MSRARWLVLSSFALVGCSGAIATTQPDGGGASDAGSAAVEPGPDGGVACPTRLGYFACGSNVCDRSVQACDSQGSCVWYGDLSPYLGGHPVSCGSCPTCECLQPALDYSGCRCQEGAGGSLAISCGGCYGAPPARLERMRA